jgi:tol-pal system protein YbgF
MEYRNQQLEAALNELRSGEFGARSGARAPAGPPGVAPGQPNLPGRRSDAFDPAPNVGRRSDAFDPAPNVSRRSDAFDPTANSNAPGAPLVLGPSAGAAPLNQPSMPGGRRSDAFDPGANPNAPGAPRVLGSIPPQPPPPASGFGTEQTPYGGGVGSSAGVDPRRFPAGSPPPPYPQGVATAPSSPRDLLDLGNGFLRRRDYAHAEDTFREFLNRYQSDRLAPEAEFGLGESLFQRQDYQDAANAFVALSKRYETSPKAPDALLRLGQSLAAMNERELACVAFGDVGRKYPRAAPSVKQAVEREEKRARC